ncbi:MAG: signal peptide peptidase SppA [Pseudomonadota bacterium]
MTAESSSAPPSKSLFRFICRQITLIRRFVVNLLFVLLMGFLVLVLIGSCQGQRPPSASALLLNPTGVLVESSSLTPGLMRLLDAEFALRETAMPDLLRAITAGTRDPAIREIVIDLSRLQSISQGQAERIGTALEAFRNAGKQTSVYAYSFQQNGYLLASYADAVYLHPMGQAMFPGVGLYTVFLRDFLERLKVDINIFRVGELKSFTETFTEGAMSDAVRAEYQGLADTLWNRWQTQVAANRSLPPERLRSYTNAFAETLRGTGGDLARAALETELVDELISEDEFNARMRRVHGGNGPNRTGDSGFSSVDFRTYLSHQAQPSVSGRYIGVLTLEGTISMSAPQGGAIGAEQSVRLLRKLRQDPELAGLVLRISSPGGSSFASELIRQELELLQLSGTPVITSMGDITASGGYWIAATSDRIFAEATTQTGSIGVFSVLPTFNRSLDELGVATDGVGTTPLSGGLSPVLGLNDAMRSVLTQSVQHTYRSFTTLIARGRELPLDQVEALADGRVVLGERALELGLVDTVGSLPDAIAALAEETGLDPAQARFLSPGADLSKFEQLRTLFTRSVFGAEVARMVLPGAVEPLLDAATRLPRFDDPSYQYALCEFCSPGVLDMSAPGLTLPSLPTPGR